MLVTDKSRVSLYRVYLVIAINLIVAHISIYLGSEDIIWTVITLVLLVFISILSHYVVFKRNVFYTLLVVYALSHFPAFLYGGGGLFNLMTALLLPLILIVGIKDIQGGNKGAQYFTFALLAVNVIGYATGELSQYHKLNGLVALIGILAAFLSASMVQLDYKRIMQILIVTSISVLHNIIVVINTRYNVIDINSPLVKSNYTLGEHQLIANAGTFSSVELYGEWSLLVFLLLLPIVSGSKVVRTKSARYILLLGITFAFIGAIVSFSKAILLLLIVGIALYLFFMFVVVRQRKSVLKSILYLSLVSLLLPVASSFFQLEYIFIRFAENPDFLKNFLADPIRAEGTTREAVYLLGIERIQEKSWIFGNGWSIPEGNNYSWFGTYRPGEFVDFHNLYLCLIPIWGYSGLSIFLFYVLIQIKHLYKKLNRLTSESNILRSVIIGVLFLLIFFLIDEYKVNATRNSYFTIFMIWLGLASNLARRRA